MRFSFRFPPTWYAGRSRSPPASPAAYPVSSRTTTRRRIRSPAGCGSVSAAPPSPTAARWTSPTGTGAGGRGRGAEARGSGSVNLALTVAAKGVEGGTTLLCTGSVRSTGRLAEFDDEAGPPSRCACWTGSPPGSPPTWRPTRWPTRPTTPGSGKPGPPTARTTLGPGPSPPRASSTPRYRRPPRPLADDLDELGGLDDVGDLDDVDEPPAEAAHARRTMIGRSTEEVDHARRAAGTPGARAGDDGPGDTLRWAAPAAALVIASVVVVGRRVLRRRGH
ncbi:hypothetical protein NKH77_28080 [Streptomyces sp. M19]